MSELVTWALAIGLLLAASILALLAHDVRELRDRIERLERR
jgi:hypothetical protein